MPGSLCESCAALCCRYFALPIDNPKTARQYDDIRWYLCHENVVVFIEDNVIRFIDASLSLLADGGQFLIGDIPNVSKRKRFFASQAGITYHKQFMNTDDAPTVHFNQLEPEHMDDGLLLGFQTRARMSGFEAFIVPQPPDLPMANRREDMLFFRP